MDLSLEERLQQIRHHSAALPAEVDESKLAAFFLKNIPFLVKLIERVDKTGLSIDKLVNLYKSTNALTKAAHGMQITAVVLAGLSFITTPLAFIACTVLGKKFPFTLSTGAKWLYSGVVFGLAVTALALPVLALPIALTTTVLAVSTSAFTLGKHFWSKRQLSKNLSQVKLQLERLEHDLVDIRKEADSLSATKAHQADIIRLHELYQNVTNERQSLVNQQAEINIKMKALGVPALMDKAVGTGLSATALAGILCSIAFPPAGLFILTVTSVAGLLYMGGRIALTIYNGRQSKLNDTTDGAENNMSHDTNQEDDHDDGPVHENTLDIAKMLYRDDLKKGLENIQNNMYHESEIANMVATRFNEIISAGDEFQSTKRAIEFMVELGEQVKASQYTEVALQDFFSSIENFDQVKPFLLRALTHLKNGDIIIDERQQSALLEVPQIKAYLGPQIKEIFKNREVLNSSDYIKYGLKERNQKEKMIENNGKDAELHITT